jgi:ABC-type transport system involved in multi-copper enzyme maturation permease subunit
MTTLVRMELLKLMKRPMTWVLIVLLLGGIGFGDLVVLLNLGSVTPEVRESILANLTLPDTLRRATQFIYIFGSIMLAILAASAIGSEYGWGTLRPLLATGVPRTRFLSAKLLALAIVALPFVILPLAMNAILAVPVALLGDHAVFVGTLDAAWFGHLAALVGRTYLIVLMPMALAFLIGLFGRSQAAGIGAALGLMIGQQVVAAVLLSLGLDWTRAVVDLFPIQSSQTLLNHNTFGSVTAEPGALGEGRALLTLGLYAVVCAVASLLVFRRRDIRGGA